MPDSHRQLPGKAWRYAACMSVLLFPGELLADGIVVDKVYHPYVEAMESELEYRAVVQEEQKDLVTPSEVHWLSFGRAIGDRMFSEFYAIANKNRNGSFDLESLEAELMWQLTEQGEYAFDWGVLFEYENNLDINGQEISTTILTEKEFGRWSGTANLKLIYEWGNDIKDEFESVLALQARYRLTEKFEPGIEFYSGQNTRGIGPVIQGTFNTGIRKKLHWETGIIFGLESKSPETSIRFLLEYEF